MMKRVVLSAAVFVSVVGFIICPKSPEAGRVNPQELFQKVVSNRSAYNYRAVRKQSYVLYGRNITKTVTLDPGEVDSCADAEMTNAALRNYTPLVEGEDVIAGRSVWILRLRPHDKHRPWKQLWVDKDKYIVLAQKDWNCRDEIKRTVRAVSISDISRNIKSIQADNQAKNSIITGTGERLPGYLPYGYRIKSISKLPHKNLTQIDYTDGLFTISLFERFSGKNGGEQMEGSATGDCGQGIVYSSRKKGFELTIVADLPVAEIKRIAESVR